MPPLRRSRGGYCASVLRIGLTGGIGSGKSTVAALLADRGARVVDADALAREVVAPGSAGLAAVAEAFGDGVLTADGALDRPALAAVVFADPAARATLDGIVHPLVRARAAQLIAAMPPHAVVVQDVPLLVETGQAASFDLVLVVEADLGVRLARLVARGLPEPDARARIAAQATDEERRAVADVVLDNSGTTEQLAEQVDRFWVEQVAPRSVQLVAVDEQVLDQLVDAALAGAEPDEVTAPVPGGPGWSPERVEWLRRFHRDRRSGLGGPPGEATWAVVAGGRVVGAVRLGRTADPDVLETGIWLTRGARGAGVGSRAVGAVLARAADSGARAVRADTGTANGPALALLRRSGFQLSVDGDRVVAERDLD